METVEVVIKMPKSEYEELQGNYVWWGKHGEYIKKGTVLPKGHGRLIDADAFERRCMFDSNIEDMQDVIYALRNYKPIIEADKDGE